MKITLKTHKPGEPAATFWIQNKGNHSGRPLKTPIANCFAVYTEEPFLFEVCFALWKTEQFRPFIIGTVIPFIRKKNVEMLLKSGAQAGSPELCQAIAATNKLIWNLEKQVCLNKQVQILTLKKFFRP